MKKQLFISLTVLLCLVSPLAAMELLSIPDSPNVCLGDPLGDTTQKIYKPLFDAEEAKKFVTINQLFGEPLPADLLPNGKMPTQTVSTPNGEKPKEISSDTKSPNEKLPNWLHAAIKQFSNTSKPPALGWKKGLLLEGFPGTGRTTFAHLIAYTLNREVLYTSGDDFRNDYQTAHTQPIKMLFSTAKNRNKPIAIIIDELYSTASLLKQTSNQEDRHIITSLVTELTTYQNDPAIFVICITNYMRNIENNLLEKLTLAPVNLPNYTMRYALLRYFLRQHGITNTNYSDTDKNVGDIFLEKLTTATRKWSNSSLKIIVDDAIQEFKAGLFPEYSVSASFNTNNDYDFEQRPVSSTLFSGMYPLFFAIDSIRDYNSLIEKHLYSQYLKEKIRVNFINNNVHPEDPSFESLLVTNPLEQGMAIVKLAQRFVSNE